MPMVSDVLFPSNAASWLHVAEANRVYGSGGFLDVLAFRIGEVPAISALLILIFPRTVSLFLFGMLAWRTGVLREPARHRPLLLALAAGGVIVGAGFTVAGKWELGGVMLALGYAATIIACVQLPRRRTDTGLGRARWPDGVHQLPDAVAGAGLDFLRLRARAVRPSRRRCRRSPSRFCCMPRKSHSVRGGCAAIATARSNGCGAA